MILLQVFVLLKFAISVDRSLHSGWPAENQWLDLVYLFYYVPVAVLLGDQVSSEHSSSGPVIFLSQVT